MATYVQKLPTVEAVLYDSSVTAAQAQAFLRNTSWDRGDLSFDPTTKVITATLGPGQVINIELGMMVVKHPNGYVHAMTVERFAREWEAI